MNKRKKKKSNSQTVNTEKSQLKQQDAIASSSKEKKDNSSLWIGRICVPIIILLLIGIFCTYQHQKKNDELLQTEKEKLYGAQIELQIEMIQDLKDYKGWVLEVNQNEEFKDLSTWGIDNLISTYIVKFKGESAYLEMMPEFNYYDSRRFKAKFSKYLSELEILALKFPNSYGVNSKIQKEFKDNKRIIERDIKDKELLKRVLALKKESSENLEKLEEMFEN